MGVREHTFALFHYISNGFELVPRGSFLLIRGSFRPFFLCLSSSAFYLGLKRIFNLKAFFEGFFLLLVLGFGKLGFQARTTAGNGWPQFSPLSAGRKLRFDKLGTPSSGIRLVSVCIALH